MALTTPNVLPAPVQQSFEMRLLAVRQPGLIHKLGAMQDRMPAHGGRIKRYRRYNKLATAPVPLGPSGETPPGQTLSAVDIDARMDWYGTYVDIHEQVTLQNQDPVLNEAVKLLGISMRETEDELTKNMLASTASLINCVYGTNGDMPTNLNVTDIDIAARTLLSNDARMMLDNVEGENKFGTAPVRNSYLGLCHTDLTPDLNNVQGFNSKDKYPSQSGIMRSEWGSVDNVRFMISSLGSITQNASALGANVYNCFIVGMESYACIHQDLASAQLLYTPPILTGPLALYARVGYKFAEVPRILNDAWILNLRTTRLI